MVTKEEYLKDPAKLLKKKPFTRGANEDLIRIYRQDTYDEDSLLAELPVFTGKIISQSQYLLELDPHSHAIMFNDDLPRLSGNPNARWDEANPYRASFAFQAQILSQHSQYVNTNGMKFVLLNQNPSKDIHNTFVEIKDEWITRNMDIYKTKLYEEQKSVGDAALLFYFNSKRECKTRLLSYRAGYQLIPQYDDNGELILFSIYYKSDGKRKIDCYDEKFIYKFVEDSNDGKSTMILESKNAHGFSQIPVVYKRGEVAWEKGQVLIDIFELLYNIYMIIEKKVGFPMLYIIGKANIEKKSDTAVMLKDSSSSDIKSDAKFLNPDEPKGFQELINDLFKKIQICTSSVLLAPDDIKITADISGIAMKMLRGAIYERASRDVQEYDEVADRMFSIFKEGVSMELKKYVAWNRCRVRASFEVWMPQSETEYVNRLVVQKTSGIISGETATELSPDSQPDENARINREAQKTNEIDIDKKLNTGGQNNG